MNPVPVVWAIGAVVEVVLASSVLWDYLQQPSYWKLVGVGFLLGLALLLALISIERAIYANRT